MINYQYCRIENGSVWIYTVFPMATHQTRVITLSYSRIFTWPQLTVLGPGPSRSLRLSLVHSLSHKRNYTYTHINTHLHTNLSPLPLYPSTPHVRTVAWNKPLVQQEGLCQEPYAEEDSEYTELDNSMYWRFVCIYLSWVYSIWILTYLLFVISCFDLYNELFWCSFYFVLKIMACVSNYRFCVVSLINWITLSQLYNAWCYSVNGWLDCRQHENITVFCHEEFPDVKE